MYMDLEEIKFLAKTGEDKIVKLNELVLEIIQFVTINKNIIYKVFGEYVTNLKGIIDKITTTTYYNADQKPQCVIECVYALIDKGKRMLSEKTINDDSDLLYVVGNLSKLYMELTDYVINSTNDHEHMETSLPLDERKPEMIIPFINEFYAYAKVKSDMAINELMDSKRVDKIKWIISQLEQKDYKNKWDNPYYIRGDKKIERIIYLLNAFDENKTVKEIKEHLKQIYEIVE